MTKEDSYGRKRKRCTFTLSEEAIDFLHESVTNASRFIDRLVLSAQSKIEPVLITISQKEDGPAEIRTQDLRRVKATS
jgi:hypothetical protein